MKSDLDPVVTKFSLVAVDIPGFLTVAAVGAQLWFLRDAPNPVAVHWSGSGPDGSGPGWIYPLLTVLTGFGPAAVLFFAGLPRLIRGARGWSFRFLAAMALGMATFAAVSMTWSVAMQRGLDSWHDAPSVLPAIIVGLALGVGAGFIGWVIQPKQEVTVNELPPTHIDLADSERAVWVGVARTGRAIVVIMVVTIVSLAAGAFVCWLTAQYAAMWILFATAVLTAVLALTTLEADVRVDASGVEVRGPAGFPRSRVALNEVASATPVTVEALGEFGGWGWRRVPGAMGVVLRSGEALRVERKEGHALVVTVDGAATAAALLTALAARASS